MKDKGGFAGVVLVGILGLFIGAKTIWAAFVGLTTPTPDLLERLMLIPLSVIRSVQLLAALVLIIGCLGLFIRSKWGQWLAITGFGGIALATFAFHLPFGILGLFFGGILAFVEIFCAIYLAIASEAFESTGGNREPLDAPYKREY